MPRPHLYRTEAVVLRRADFGEADKLLTLYTPQRGLLRALAKGVRRPKSKLGGHVELFTHSHLLIAQGRNLDLVTQAETIHSFLPLRQDLWRTGYAYHVAELVEYLTAEGLENYPVWSLLLEVLGRLAQSPDPELAVRFFEVQLLGQLGYRPELERCLRCQRLLQAVPNFFSAPAGGVLCADCGRREAPARPLSVNALKVLRLLQKGDYPLACRLRLLQTLRQELDAITRAHLRFVMEREPKSARFLDILRCQPPASSALSPSAPSDSK